MVDPPTYTTSRDTIGQLADKVGSLPDTERVEPVGNGRL